MWARAQIFGSPAIALKNFGVILPIAWLYTLFYKQHFNKQHQAEIGKIWSKISATP